MSEILLIPVGLHCWALLLLRGVLASVFFAMAGCAATHQNSLSFEELLVAEDLTAKKQQAESEHFLAKLDEQGILFEQPYVRATIDGILQRIFNEQEQTKLRVHFARLPGENAFALPSGDIVVHLAMLAALETEEQLAFVLAHEASHILNKHAWHGALNRKSKRIVAHLTDLLTLGSGMTYRHFAESVQRFGREQEYSADRDASTRLEQAAFDISKAAEFFTTLDTYPLALSGKAALYTHPGNSERKSRLLKVASAPGYVNSLPTGLALKVAGTSKKANHYYQFRRPLLLLSIEDKIEEQDYPGALIQISALEDHNEPLATTECLRGQVYAGLSQDELQSTLALREASMSDSPAADTAVSGLLDEGDASASDFFSRQSELSFLAASQADPHSACAKRGIAVLNHLRGKHLAAWRQLQAYLAEHPDDLQHLFLRQLLQRSRKAAELQRMSPI